MSNVRYAEKSMEKLKVVWRLTKGLISVILFWGALSAVNSNFEVLTVAGIGLVYSSVVHYGTLILKAHTAGEVARTTQYLATRRAIDKESVSDEHMDALNSIREQARNQESEVSTMLFFNAVIWLSAIAAAITHI